MFFGIGFIKTVFHFDGILQCLIQAVKRSVKNLMQSTYFSTSAGRVSDQLSNGSNFGRLFQRH